MTVYALRSSSIDVLCERLARPPRIELHIDALLTFSASRVTSLHSPPPLHPSDRGVAAMGAANRQPIAGHGQHAAWRAVPLGRDASPPISAAFAELCLQHGQPPVDITGCDGVWIRHVAAPRWRRLMILRLAGC